MMVATGLLLLSQAIGPEECILTGLCFRPEPAGPPAGLWYLALGLVALGTSGLVREWRARRAPRRES
ncbi:MAG: hypothetical protein AB7S39_11320 [Gemmatimonadales bacterium]